MYCILQIGNPLLELGTDFNSEDLYYWSHGVISDAAYALLNRVCNSSEMFREAIRGIISSDCAFVNIQVSKELTDSSTHTMSLVTFVYQMVNHKWACCINLSGLGFKLCHLSIQNQILLLSR